MRLRLPRPRLTVRSKMVLVAASAMALVVVVPLGRGLIYLWQLPPGATPLFRGGVNGLSAMPIRSGGYRFVNGQRRDLAGNPIAVAFTYSCAPLPPIPAGLLYLVVRKASLVDTSTPAFTLIEARSSSTWVISGVSGWDVDEGVYTATFTPGKPAGFSVFCDVEVIDLLGRRSRIARNTAGFHVE